MRTINKQTISFLLIILIPLFSWFLFGCVFDIIRIDGVSMEPTLYDGNLLLGNRLFRGLPDRGDIVAVKRPDKIIIKRVIGIEGDIININSQTGEIYLNDIALDEPYLLEKIIDRGIFDVSLIVPEGHIYILGDNRAESLDSRYIGTVPTSDVRSEMIFRFYK